jgi:hypothetical protein
MSLDQLTATERYTEPFSRNWRFEGSAVKSESPVGILWYCEVRWYNSRAAGQPSGLYEFKIRMTSQCAPTAASLDRLLYNISSYNFLEWKIVGAASRGAISIMKHFYWWGAGTSSSSGALRACKARH